MTHTPGPWHTNGGSAVFHQLNAGGRKTYICETSGDPSINQRRANARLIAAAPTMLKALRLAQFAFGFGSSATLEQQQEAAEAITTAILEATNGNP